MRVKVIKKTLFKFDGRAGSTTEITLQNAVPFDFTSCVLEARLHSSNTWSSTATAVVAVQNIQIPEEEPHTFFLPATGVADVASLTILSTDASPLLYTASFTSPGSHLKVMLRWLQGTVAGTGQQNIGLGVDLLGRQD